MKRLLVVACAAGVAFACAGRSVNITLWRGETATKILHDYARVGDAPDGFEVKVGTAHEVRYLTRPFGTHYESFADRVEWGSKKPGVKVLSVAAPADAKPGVYRAGDVKITVIDRVLPPSGEWKYFLDLWQHPWAVSRYFGVKPFSLEHYAKMRPLWKMLAGAGQKTLTVTLLDKPWDNQCYDAYGTMIRHIKTKDGKWRFDYSVFDEYVAFGSECGLGPVISCYTMCPWGYMATWEEEDGTVRKAKAVPGTKEFRNYWGDFLADFAAHLKAKGWFEDAVVSIDERSPDDVRDIAALIAEKAPGLKVAIAGNRSPSQFEGIDIHHACFGLYHLTDKLIAEAKERGERGKVTTYYVCCSPDHPNTLCHNELEEAFWLGAYPAFAGLDGFLRWAWNSWPEDPVHDASYTGIGSGWKAGDTYLVYPDGSPSLRFLELRSGIVAAEKVRILKEEGLFADEIAALGAKFDRKAALANKADFGKLKSKTLGIINNISVGSSPARRLGVMSYNVHYCTGADKNLDFQRVADAIMRERPDFVGLNEVDCLTKRSGNVDMAAELGKLTGLHATFGRAIPYQGGDYGVAVLSRKAPLSVVRVPLPGKEPRVLLLCEFADFWFGTAHLDFGAYQQQAVKIVRGVVAEKSAAKPVFLTGDWNATPKSETLAAMKDFMTVISKEDCRTFHGFKNHPPEDEYCIDYIAIDSAHAGRVCAKESHVTTDIETSDHNPVFVSLELK